MFYIVHALRLRQNSPTFHEQPKLLVRPELDDLSPSFIDILKYI